MILRILPQRRRARTPLIVLCAFGLSMLAACSAKTTTQTATEPVQPGASVAVEPEVSFAPTPLPTAGGEPDEPGAAVTRVSPQPTGLTGPILVSDGTTISRVDTDGTTEELYQAEPSGTIYDFASDGAGGVMFQEDDEFKETDYIGWVIDGDVSYPIVAEAGIELDLVGVVEFDEEPQLMYQRINSCCGALESMGTLRIASLADGSSRALRTTGAWERTTDFSALTMTRAVALEGAHEASTVLEIDLATGETLQAIEVGNLTGMVVSTEEQLLIASVREGEGQTELTLSTIDESGEPALLFSMAVESTARVVDVFVDGEMVVISRRHYDPADQKVPAVIVIDLLAGTGRELDVRGVARPDRVPRAAAVGSTLDTLTFDDIAFDDLRLGMSKDDVVESLGEPTATSEFAWGGGLVGYNLDYDDLSFEIHYDVSSLSVRRDGSCTAAGVCVGGTFTDIERAYGFGQVSTTDLGPDETRLVVYEITGGGYCSAAFTLGRDAAGVEIVQQITASCLPD